MRACQLRNHLAVASSVYSRALQKAAELVGGREKLAAMLQIAKADLDRWIADQAKPPREIFLRIVEIILDQTGPANDGDSGPHPAREASDPSGRYLD